MSSWKCQHFLPVPQQVMWWQMSWSLAPLATEQKDLDPLVQSTCSKTCVVSCFVYNYRISANEAALKYRKLHLIYCRISQYFAGNPKRAFLEFFFFFPYLPFLEILMPQIYCISFYIHYMCVCICALSIKN